MEWEARVDSSFLYPPHTTLHGIVHFYLGVLHDSLTLVQKQRPKAPGKGLKFAPRGVHNSRTTRAKTTTLPVLKF